MQGFLCPLLETWWAPAPGDSASLRGGTNKTDLKPRDGCTAELVCEGKGLRAG